MLKGFSMEGLVPTLWAMWAEHCMLRACSSPAICQITSELSHSPPSMQVAAAQQLLHCDSAWTDRRAHHSGDLCGRKPLYHSLQRHHQQVPQPLLCCPRAPFLPFAACCHALSHHLRIPQSNTAHPYTKMFKNISSLLKLPRQPSAPKCAAHMHMHARWGSVG